VDPAFSVHVDDGVDLRNTMVVVGCPGTGLVGATAAKHLISALDMKCVGSIRAAHQPPVALVRGGRASHPIRIYYVSGQTVIQSRAERIAVVDVERQPHPSEELPLAAAIVTWARDAGCHTVVVPGGVSVTDEALDDKVWGCASSPEGVEMLRRMQVELLDGVVGGLAAGILNAGEAEDIETLCFLAEAAPGYPDAHAAARIVKLLDSMTLAFLLPDQPLVAEAERIEKELRASLELMDATRGHSGLRRKG
jgi:predicted ATP-grasp superfamily ATP-dependent carboligase